MSESDNAEPAVCVFCGSAEDNELRYGKVHHYDGITVHYFCLLFSANLHQCGEDDEGILGFLIGDIRNEVKRGMRLSCSYCKKRGATVGCCVPRCKKSFHLPCGIKRGSQHIFEDDFRSYCVHHRQQEPVHQRLRDITERITCSICYDEIDLGNIYEVLWAPCCKENAFFHRDCVQQFAISAGYFFKCPLCNNKEEFQAVMTRNGVFVPSQDAAWELEPNAFQELQYKHNRCDAPVCACHEGRHHNSGGKWKLILCETCASQGIHAACGGRRSVGSPWHCADCSSVLVKRNANRGNSKGTGDPARDFESLIYESWRKKRKRRSELPPGPWSFKQKILKRLRAQDVADRRRALKSFRQLRTSTEGSKSTPIISAIDSGDSPSHSGTVSASFPTTFDKNRELCADNQFRAVNTVQLPTNSFTVRRSTSWNPPMAVINPTIRSAGSCAVNFGGNFESFKAQIDQQTHEICKTLVVRKECAYLHTSFVNNPVCEVKNTETMDSSTVICQPSNSGELKEPDSGFVDKDDKSIGNDDTTESRLSKAIQQNLNCSINNVDFDTICREKSDTSTDQLGFVNFMKRTFYYPSNLSIRWPKLW